MGCSSRKPLDGMPACTPRSVARINRVLVKSASDYAGAFRFEDWLSDYAPHIDQLRKITSEERFACMMEAIRSMFWTAQKGA